MSQPGCYDIEGRCVNCGHYHPCECESMPVDDQEKEDADKAIDLEED